MLFDINFKLLWVDEGSNLLPFTKRLISDTRHIQKQSRYGTVTCVQIKMAHKNEPER